MSILSFKAFCIEHYAQHSGIPSNRVYVLFAQEGLLDLLDNDYEDLHGMGIEYLMQFFDQYLKGEVNRMEIHSTVRATVLPEIIAKIMEKYQVDENTALDMFYRSATGESFSDDETGLYGQSPNYVFGLFLEEQER